MCDFIKDLTLKIRARSGCLWVTTEEEFRAESKIRQVADNLEMSFWVWRVSTGLVQNPAEETDTTTMLPQELPNRPGLVKTLLNWDRGPSLIVIEDPSQYFTQPQVARMMKDLDEKSKTSFGKEMAQVVVIDTVAPSLSFFSPVELGLPSREELRQAITSLSDSTANPLPDYDEEEVLDAVVGLQTAQAEQALAESIIDQGAFDARRLVKSKKNLISGGDSALEWVDTDGLSLDDVGGLEELIQWLLVRKNSFSEEAKAYGVPKPKGVLLAGLPGTGKSHVAKVLSQVLNMPLIRLNMGAVFSKFQGDSEGNMRKVQQTANAISPCILWVDEIDKAFSGVGGSGEGDSGTSKRIFGEFLNWLAENEKPVFVVATANKPTTLPAELLRAGRFDEKFWLGIPTERERIAIVEVMRRKYPKTTGVKNFDVAKETKNMTGAEIEQAFIESMHTAFNDGARNVRTEDVVAAASNINPVVEAWKDDLKEIQEWSKRNCRPATREAQIKNKIIHPSRRLS